MTLTQRPAPPETPRRRGALAMVGPFAAVTAAGLAAAVTLATVDPNEPGHYPSCPFLSLTGLFCPGCGALRSIHAILHGDLTEAVVRSPLTVIAIPYLLLAWVTWGLRSLGRRVPRSTSLPAWVLWALLVLVVGFGVLRNVSGFEVSLGPL